MEKLARATILVVDDDPGIRDALHLILDDDYEVIDAVDGGEALATLSSRPIDLILLDLVMVRGDGFEVLARRREEHRNVPIIVLSGLNNAWTAATAMRLGALDYVTKPFDEDDLHELIRGTLAARGGPRARVPSVLLVGLDLGVYASLAVLLRQRCRVVYAATVIEALGSPESSSASVVVIDLGSPGQHGPAMLARLRGHFADAQLVAIDADRRSSVTKLLDPIRTCLPTRGAAGLQYSARVGSILDHLGGHYVDASVRLLARTIGASPDHLSTCFREEIGLSLKVYMTEIRIEAAKWLLIEGGEKVEVVAMRVGLHDAFPTSRGSSFDTRELGREHFGEASSPHPDDTWSREDRQAPTVAVVKAAAFPYA